MHKNYDSVLKMRILPLKAILHLVLVYLFSYFIYKVLMFLEYEPVHEKTNNLGFRPGLTQTRLYSHRRWSEA